MGRSEYPVTVPYSGNGRMSIPDLTATLNPGLVSNQTVKAESFQNYRRRVYFAAQNGALADTKKTHWVRSKTKTE
jgi:hypothetical protein